MDRFTAHVRRCSVRPGEVIPYNSELTLTDWLRLKMAGFVAETLRGVFVLTARGHRAAWHGFAEGAPEIVVGDSAGWVR